MLEPLAFRAHGELAEVPNVVVDGSPTPATTLLLTHWPNLPVPAGYERDLSAEMARDYAGAGVHEHGEARFATNDHLDQDGLVSLLFLVDPAAALPRRDRLVEVARAGDFAVTSDRDAARVSMAISGLADPGRSPLGPFPPGYPAYVAALYPALLERLPALVDDVGSVRPLWEEEDARLSASEAALADGRITIDEHPDVDLAVVVVDPALPDLGGERFVGERFHDVHPIALHAATDRLRILLVKGERVRFTYRYESWVQYASRPVSSRVALEPLADALSSLDDAPWVAQPVRALTPTMAPSAGGTSLEPAVVVDRLAAHLRDGAPAWDPYALR